MTEGLYLSRAKLSTRLALFAAGFGVACWAPLVPFAKTRCHLGYDTMGLVLLLLGAGSIVAMPLAAKRIAFAHAGIALSDADLRFYVGRSDAVMIEEIGTRYGLTDGQRSTVLNEKTRIYALNASSL